MEKGEGKRGARVSVTLKVKGGETQSRGRRKEGEMSAARIRKLQLKTVCHARSASPRFGAGFLFAVLRPPLHGANSGLPCANGHLRVVGMRHCSDSFPAPVELHPRCAFFPSPPRHRRGASLLRPKSGARPGRSAGLWACVDRSSRWPQIFHCGTDAAPRRPFKLLPPSAKTAG